MSETWNHGVRGKQVLPLIGLDAEAIRVEAGPGTGKTFGLVRRVERILHPDGLGVPGHELLVVAFNRVIAKQLQADIESRLKTFTHEGAPKIVTVHALCVGVIGQDLRLLLPHERECLIYDVLDEFPALSAVYKKFSDAEQALSEHEAGHADHHQLWAAARQWLVRHQATLVSDLPGLLLAHLKAGDFTGGKYRHVIVDEFQDLTPAEQELMFRLKAVGGQLVALGDPRQSIYRFRGNDPGGLAKLDVLAKQWGAGNIADVPMNECQRCPAPVVRAANRLMSLSGAEAMVSVSDVTAALHAVTWPDPHAEADGMAKAIVANIAKHPKERHLVMVTRRQFGFWLRDRIGEIDKDLKVELSFSEGLLETWAVREAFLMFCLLADPDAPTWRAWLGYQNAPTGKHFKAPKRNAGSYLRLLTASSDQIELVDIATLAAEARTKQR